MANQQSLVLIKPDGLIKSLTGNIITIFSETQLKIVGAKIVSVSKDLAEEHYKEHKGKHFFENLIKYIMGEFHTNRVLALVYEGEDAINKIRCLVGATNPEEADPISIRGKYGRISSKTGISENVTHASANEEDAQREIKLWFQPNELSNTIYPTEEKETTKTEHHWK